VISLQLKSGSLERRTGSKVFELDTSDPVLLAVLGILLMFSLPPLPSSFQVGIPPGQNRQSAIFESLPQIRAAGCNGRSSRAPRRGALTTVFDFGYSESAGRRGARKLTNLIALTAVCKWASAGNHAAGAQHDLAATAAAVCPFIGLFEPAASSKRSDWA
jgi:hypothetical protein